MACDFRTRKESGNGCEYWANGGYCNHEICEFYHCVDWMASGKYVLSYSQINEWERCPYKWYVHHVLGVTVKSELTTVALRQGSYFADLMAGKEKENKTLFLKEEWVNKKYIEFMVNFIREREMLPFDDLDWEVRIEREGFLGYIDLRHKRQPTFGEMKFANPDFYLNNPMARNQLEGYFYADPELKDGWMLPVRSHDFHKKTRSKKDTEPEQKLEDVKKDVHKRPVYYFPGYKEDKKPFKWGRKFSLLEFDVVEFKKKIDWVRREIMLSCAEQYFVQRSANCLSPFPCDYLPIFDTGDINWELFERKGRKFQEKKESLKAVEEDVGIVYD